VQVVEVDGLQARRRSLMHVRVWVISNPLDGSAASVVRLPG
jgi:hypothetical protein